MSLTRDEVINLSVCEVQVWKGNPQESFTAFVLNLRGQYLLHDGRSYINPKSQKLNYAGSRGTWVNVQLVPETFGDEQFEDIKSKLVTAGYPAELIVAPGSQ